MVSTDLMGELFEQYWKDPDNTDALRVWADALIERGDPRGEYVQLCLGASSAEQEQKRRALEKKHYQAGEGTYEDHTRPRIAPIDDYAEVVATSPGFRSLRVLFLRGADPGRLRDLPNLVTVETSPSGGIDAPRNARQLEKLKTATPTAA